MFLVGMWLPEKGSIFTRFLLDHTAAKGTPAKWIGHQGELDITESGSDKSAEESSQTTRRHREEDRESADQRQPGSTRLIGTTTASTRRHPDSQIVTSFHKVVQ